MQNAERLVSRHAMLRYLGMPLFLGGALGLAGGLIAWGSGSVPGGVPLLYLGATGLSLGTFGTHNDTAIAAMVAVGEEGLEPAHRNELRAELERDRAGTLELTAMPKTAAVITVVALAFHALAAVKLLG